jgi:site-specific DNA recombinase
MRAIGYCRVSTEEQSREGVSLDMQAHKIRQYCELHDLELSEIVSDEGISGKTINGRPGIQKVLESVKKKAVDAVIIYSLSRLARNTIECLQVSETFKKKGVTLHSITEKLDTGSATGEFFFTLLASLAQMERKLIGERTTAAMGRKREKGERISRQAPFGYRFEGTEVWPDEVEQGIIRKIRMLSENGLSIRKISTALADEGVFNRADKPFGVAEIHKVLKVAERF